MAIGIWQIFKEIIYRNRDRHAIPSMEGPLQPNEALDHLPVVCQSFPGIDDVVIDEEGRLYISSEHRVMRLSGEDYKNQEVFYECDAPAGGLGIYPDGRLMVCISERGVVLVDENGRQDGIDTVQGSAIKCPTSVTAGPDGKIYITDGTVHHNPQDWVWDLMEKQTAGRLICYEPETGKSEILLKDLAYPYGVCLTHDLRSLLLTESWQHTLWQYPLDNLRPGAGERVIPNMPGYPARIVPSGDGGYWMCLFGMRTALLEFILTQEKYRQEMMKTIDSRHWIRPVLSLSNDGMEPLQAGHIVQLGIVKPWAPPRSYGLIIKLDENYDPIKSLHSRVDGRCHGITGLRELKNELCVVSKGHNKILKVSRESLQ